MTWCLRRNSGDTNSNRDTRALAKESAALCKSDDGAAAKEKLAAAAKQCPYLAEVWELMEQVSCISYLTDHPRMGRMHDSFRLNE